MFGTTVTGKGHFDGHSSDEFAFSPPAYPLDFFGYTGIGAHSHGRIQVIH